MALSRDRDKEIYFECDGKRCAEVLETNCFDFESALEKLEEEGWTYRKTADGWKHYCPDEDDDSEILNAKC